MSNHNHNYFYPLVFPFYQEKWFSKTWWLNIIALVPIVNLILFSGWRYCLIRNMAHQESSILPDANILSFFRYGLILWFVATIYLIVPMILIFTVGSGVGGSIMELGSWFAGTITQDPNVVATDEMLVKQSSDFGIRLMIEIVWLFISVPILNTGLARYAVTGNVSTLFNLPANMMYATKHLGAHFMMWVFKFFMIIFVGIVTTILVASVLLAILAPMFGLLVYYWSTGFELGHLAKRINSDMCIKGSDQSYLVENSEKNDLIESSPDSGSRKVEVVGR